jgi:hypothetical protein
MSRSMLVATTLAAVCSVGAQGIANTSGPDKPQQSMVTGAVSTEVLNFLSADTARAQLPVYLSKPLSFECAPSLSLRDVDLSTRHRVCLHSAREMPTAELPLVPLPSPLWTGTAGLVGLGTIRAWKRIRKTLH